MQFDNPRILLVEDDRVSQLLIADVLEKAGCRVDTVQDGERAIEMLHRNTYDLLLMDCHMPVMDGFEASQKIRSGISKTLPIVALTANESKECEAMCMEAGMNAYVSKPVDREKLFQLIRNLLRT